MKDRVYNFLHVYCDKRQKLREAAKETNDHEVICKNKRAFLSRKNAKDFIKQIKCVKLLYVYKCSFCNLWHTSKKKK